MELFIKQKKRGRECFGIIWRQRSIMRKTASCGALYSVHIVTLDFERKFPLGINYTSTPIDSIGKASFMPLSTRKCSWINNKVVVVKRWIDMKNGLRGRQASKRLFLINFSFIFKNGNRKYVTQGVLVLCTASKASFVELFNFTWSAKPFDVDARNQLCCSDQFCARFCFCYFHGGNRGACSLWSSYFIYNLKKSREFSTSFFSKTCNARYGWCPQAKVGMVGHLNPQRYSWRISALLPQQDPTWWGEICSGIIMQDRMKCDMLVSVVAHDPNLNHIFIILGIHGKISGNVSAYEYS